MAGMVSETGENEQHQLLEKEYEEETKARDQFGQRIVKVPVELLFDAVKMAAEIFAKKVLVFYHFENYF